MVSYSIDKRDLSVQQEVLIKPGLYPPVRIYIDKGLTRVNCLSGPAWIRH